MAKKPGSNSRKVSAQPHFHQSAGEVQPFGSVTAMFPLQLEEPVRLEMTEQLNQLLADTITLRDLYKKSHWQVSGPTFYQLHLLFDKHYGEQNDIVDTIAERIQLLGGVSIAMAHDVAELTSIPRPPKGREEVPVQLSRLLDAHEIIITQEPAFRPLCLRTLWMPEGKKGFRRSWRNQMRIRDIVRRRPGGADARLSLQRCAEC